MFGAQSGTDPLAHERRRYPRYDVTASRMSVAVEDESLGESIGIGEAGDISLGGLRVRRLPASTHVRLGDRLGLLLIDEEGALSLRGQVVHHGTEDSFGVEFRDLSTAEQQHINDLLRRFHV